MGEEEGITTEPGSTEGQVSEGSETITDTTTEGVNGQSGAGTTEGGTLEDVIFDPSEFDRMTKELPPELQSQAQALRKSLQGDYSKKTQEVAKHRQKIDAYDAFTRDPVTQIQNLAQRLGYTVTRAEAQQAAQGQGEQSWEPQSWGEVLERAEQNILQKLSPFLGEMQTMKKTAVEKQLNEIDPEWARYEDKMKENLSTHPTLSKDPVTLYRMSVPEEVFESRATQRALRRIEQKTQSSKIQGSSTTTKHQKTELGDKPLTFQEAVEKAKAVLAEQGIRPGQ